MDENELYPDEPLEDGSESSSEEGSSSRRDIGDETREFIEQASTGGNLTPEDIARRDINIPRINDGVQENNFSLAISKIPLRAGNRFSGAGGENRAFTDVPEYYRTFRSPNTDGRVQLITSSRTFQTRGLNAIDVINFGRTQIERKLDRSYVEPSIPGSPRLAQQYTRIESQVSRLSGLTDLPIYGSGIPGVRQEQVQVYRGTKSQENQLMFSSAERKADQTRLNELVIKLQDLRRKLGPGVITNISVNERAGRAVSVKVSVRNFNDQYDRFGILTSTASPIVQREHSFTLTVDSAGNVTDVGNNRIMTGAAFSMAQSGGTGSTPTYNSMGGIMGGSKIGGQLVTSGVDTAVSFVATYARSTFVEAKTSVLDNAFNAMVDQGDLTALGRVMGEMMLRRVRAADNRYGVTFGQIIQERLSSANTRSTYRQNIRELIYDIAASKDDILEDPVIKAQLEAKLDSEGLSMGYFKAKLFEQRALRLQQAFQPILDKEGIKSDLRAQTEKVLLAVQDLATSKTQVRLPSGELLSVDLFNSLKQAAVAASPYGSTYYAYNKQGLSKTILGVMQAPFLQPHETGYSNGALQARLGLYANPEATGPRNFYDFLYSAGTPYLNPSPFRHGDIATAPGFVFRPLASMATPKSTSRKLLTLQERGLEGDKTEKVATFYRTDILLTSTPQLSKTTLGKFESVLKAAGYAQSSLVKQAFQDSLRMARVGDQEAEDQEIFILPFKKAEQTTQRLKNIVGTRNAYEVSLDLYRRARSQQSLDSYYLDTGEGKQLDFGRTLVGQLNVSLPAAQFALVRQELDNFQRDYLREYGKPPANEEVEEYLLRVFRTAEVNPHTALRGIIGGRAQRRVLTGLGSNQLSDFMYLNEGYQAAFGYVQTTNVRLNEITLVKEVNGRSYVEDVSFAQKRAILNRAFGADSIIYYAPQELKSEGTKSELRQQFIYEMQQAEKLAPLKNLDQNLRRQLAQQAATEALRSRYSFIDKLTFGADGTVTGGTLQPGLYELKGDTIRNLGVYEHSQLVIGVTTGVNDPDAVGPGGVSLRRPSAQQYKIKVGGIIRSAQGGVAIPVRAPQYLEGDGPSITAQIELQVLMDRSQVRPGIGGTKGPSFGTKRAGFDLVDELYSGTQYFSRSTMEGEAYALMAANSMKGYNFEVGLDVIRDEGSYRRLVNKSSAELATNVALLFAGGTDEKAQTFRRLLSESAQRRGDRATSLLVRQAGSKVGFNLDVNEDGSSKFKAANLIMAAPGLVMLAEGAELDSRLKDGRVLPFYQIRDRLITALEAEQQGDTTKLDSFKDSMVRLFEKARGDDNTIIGKSFDESDNFVRGAAVLADLLVTTEQGFDYLEAVKKRGGARSLLSMTEFGQHLVDKQGKVNVGMALEGPYTLGIRDMLERSGLFSASDQVFDRLAADYKAGRDLSQDRQFRELETGLRKLYTDTQLDPKVQRAINILPSRILTAIGSEDEVSLEMQYLFSYSTKTLQRLRGTVTDISELSATQVAYNVLTTMGTSPTNFNRMQVINPFGGKDSALGRLVEIQRYVEAATVFSNEQVFTGRAGTRTLSNEYAKALLTSQKQADQILSVVQLAKGAITADYGDGADSISRRTENLVTALDPRRLAGELGNIPSAGKAKKPNAPKVLIFFDTETADLVDRRFDIGDVNRYPDKLSELGLIKIDQDGNELGRQVYYVQDDQGRRVKPYVSPQARAAGHTEPDINQRNLYSAQDTIRGFLSAIRSSVNPEKGIGLQDIALAGHNIRSFDLPMLVSQMEKLGGFSEDDFQLLENIRTVDTRYDINRAEVGRRFNTNKFTLENLYNAMKLEQAQDAMLNSSDADVRMAAARSIQDGSYKKVQTHTAESDIEQNIELYRYLKRDIRAMSPMVTDGQVTDVSKALQQLYKVKNLDSVTNAAVTERAPIYFGSSQDGAGAFRFEVADYLAQVTKESDGRSLIYELHKRRDNLGRKFSYQNDGVVFDHLIAAAEKITDRTGVARSSKGRLLSPDEVRARTLRETYKSDRELERAVKRSLSNESDAFVGTLETQLAAFRQMAKEATEGLRPDFKVAERAQLYASDLFQSKMMLLPITETVEAPDGTRIIKPYNARQIMGPQDTQQAVEFGTIAVPLLGLDTLRVLPKNFEGYSSEIIGTQAEIRELLPKYQEIMRTIQEEGRVVGASSDQIETMGRMGQLAIKASEQLAVAAGSVLKQQTQGEKVKYPGRSYIAVSSYLLGLDEVAVGQLTYGALETNSDYYREVDGRLKGRVRIQENAEGRSIVSARFSVLENPTDPFSMVKSAMLVDDDTLRALGFDQTSEVYRQQERLRDALADVDALPEETRRTIYAALERPFEETSPTRLRAVDAYQLDGYSKIQSLATSADFINSQQTLRTALDGLSSDAGVVARTLRSPNPDRPLLGGLLDSINVDSPDVIAKSEAYQRNMSNLDYLSTVDQFNQQGMAMQRAIVSRAGAPSTASSQVDMQSVIRTIEQLSTAGEGSFLQASTDEINQSVMLMPAYGRFGAQGGDFDGDAYQLLFGYDDQIKELRNKQNIERSLNSALENINRELKSTTLPEDYRQFRQEELEQTEDQLLAIRSQIAQIQESIPQYAERRSEFVKRGMRGMRRSVAGYAGIAPEILSEESGIFGFAEVANLIEQQRGTTPNFEKYSEESLLNRKDLVNYVDEIVRSDPFKRFVEDKDVNILDRILADEKLNYRRSLKDSDIDFIRELTTENLERLGRASGVDERVQILTEEVSEQAARLSVVMGARSFLESAAGTAMSNRNFESLTTVIGSVGTTLIGEGYNAITTLINRGATARAIGEVMGFASTASGFEGDEPLSRPFNEQILESMRQLFPDERLTEDQRLAKLYIENKLGNPQQFGDEISRRSDLITGTLGIVQQLVRDSLKPKEAGGLLQAISKLGPDGVSFQERFLAEEDSRLRYEMLRDFVSDGAGASLVRPTGGDYMMNAFGALLVMSDYMKTEEGQERRFSQMVGIEAPEDNTNRYDFLRLRRQELIAELEDQDRRGVKSADYSYKAELVANPKLLVEQTVLDLLNVAAAEKAADTMFGQGEKTVRQVTQIRDRFQEALGYKTYDGPSTPEIVEQQEFIKRSLTSNSDYAARVTDILDLTSDRPSQFSPKEAQEVMKNLSLAYRESFGLNIRDLQSMRQVMTASRSLRFQTGEVAEVFSDFLAAQSENVQAFNMLSARDKLNDPVEVRQLQLRTAESYAEAMAKVTNRLTQQYGSLELALGNDEIMRGFTGMAQVSGLFGQGDGTFLPQTAEEMLALAMARRGKDGEGSMFEQLANRFAGLRAYEENEARMIDLRSRGVSTDDAQFQEYERFRQQYQEAVEKDAQFKQEGLGGRYVQEFYEAMGEQRRKERMFSDERIAENINNLEGANRTRNTNALMDAASLFAAPIAMAMLTTDLKPDENMMLRGFDVAQSLAQMQDNRMAQRGDRRRFNNNFKMMGDRIRQQIESDNSYALGGVRGAAVEALMSSMSRGISEVAERAGGRGRGGRSAVAAFAAELGSTVAGMAIARTISGKTYGPQKEKYRDYIEQSLNNMAQQAALYMEAMFEEADVDVSGETEDSIVSFDITRTALPTDYDVRIETGWLEIDYSDGGQESEMDYMNDVAEANAPIGN